VARSAVLNVSVLVDAAQAAAGLNQTTSKFESFAKDMGKAVAGAFAVDKIKDFVVGAVNAASNLNETMSKSATIFGKNADAIDAWGNTAADSMGMSKEAAVGAAAGFGNFFQQVGITGNKAAQMSTSVVQLASDFASFNNLDTANVLDAISGAMNGEYDSLQRMVPTINAAAVEHEALAESGKKSKDELTAADKAAAVYTLTFQGAGAAVGDFAKTQDGLANSQRIMNAHWEDSQAAIGQAFLPAVTGATQFLSDVLIPALTAVGTAVGAALGWLLQLPGPILAVSVAFAAWQLIGATTIMANLGAALLVAKSSISSLLTTVKTATSSMAGFKSVMSGLAGSIASGLAFAGIVLIIAAVTSAINANSEAADKGKSSLDDYVQALVQSGNKSTDATAAAFKAAVLGSDAFKQMTSEGMAAADAVKVLAGTQEQWLGMTQDNGAAVQGLSGDTKLLISGFIDANGEAGKLAQAQIDGANAMGFNAEETQNATGAVEDNADAQAKAAEETQKAAVAAAQLAVDSSAVATTLGAVSTASKQASDAVDFFVIAMQQASGTTPSVDQAAQLLNSSIRDTAAAFKDAGEKGGLNKEALLAWNVGALTASEGGDKVYSSLVDMQTAYATTTTAAYANAGGVDNSAEALAAAATAADGAYNQFIKMATGALGSKEAAEQLAAKLGIVNSTHLDTKTLEMIGDKRKLDADLAAAQAAKIDPKTIEVTANVTTAKDVMAAASAGVPDATIKAMANTKAADSALKSTADATYAATVDTKANTTPADSQLSKLTGAARDTTVQVLANTSNAVNAINAVTSWVPSATISVGANTRPANDAISAVTNGHYTAQIIVTANVSQATAAIAAIPRSVGVTAPPPAAPAVPGLTTFGARSTAGASTSINYNITLKGGITDPDGAARAIRRVLDQRDRRSTSVVTR
jgi:hypothetical protein